MNKAPAWRQYNIVFHTLADAEMVAAADLTRELEASQRAGLLRTWWYMRKQPWKLRYQAVQRTTVIDDLLNRLVGAGQVASWVTGTYEPETRAFGGADGMEVAHRLFHHDSRHLLMRAASAAGSRRGRREAIVVMCHALMRGAGLDWYEQGEVWNQVAELRSDLTASLPTGDRTTRLRGIMRGLMLVDPRALTRPDLMLDGHGEWIEAFEQAGQELASLDARGKLKRGLRAVIAHHVIFHANRAGVPARDQSAMASLALNIVFADPGGTARTSNTKREVVTNQTDRTETTAEEYRTALTEALLNQGTIKSPSVAAALRTLPREVFLPGHDLRTAYADMPVYTKANASGAQISAASQPVIVVRMLEQLGLQPGDTVYEAGAGTGINAGYMALIVGDEGRVYSSDFDRDICDGAQQALNTSGIDNVEILHRDGALGYPEAAPFSKIIATAGAYEVPTPWLDQLAPGGRLVVPLRLRGTASRSVAFERGDDSWYSVSSELCVFMPLRGLGDDARRQVAVANGVTLQVHRDQTAHSELLAGVLDTERHYAWTGVTFPAMVSFEWMELWLACTLANSLMRMNVDKAAIDSGEVTPMFPSWGAMSTTCDDSIAYLTLRRLPDTPSGRLDEVGVIGHGPQGAQLAEEVFSLIRTWGEQYRDRTVRFEMPDEPDTADPASGRFVLDRPSHPITVIWM